MLCADGLLVLRAAGLVPDTSDPFVPATSATA
jgi:hypothetical protein